MRWQYDRYLGYYTAETPTHFVSVAEAFIQGWKWVIRSKDEHGFFTDQAVAGIFKLNTLELAMTDCEQSYGQLRQNTVTD